MAETLAPDKPSEARSGPERAGRKQKRWRRLAIGLSALVGLPILAHGTVVATTGMDPPALELPAAEVRVPPADPDRREVGQSTNPSYARKRGAIHEVRLVGGPATIGQHMMALLKPEHEAIERRMQAQFSEFVPSWLARTALVDLSRVQFRHLDDQLSDRYRTEIAAQAAAYVPDPFADFMPTYQRFVFLHSLYDIMLSFEHSPLIGCTSFVLRDGDRAILGRNFDFEGPQILDDEKAVFLVFETGRIPYASVSWPGFVGTASGVNREGVAVVIHGARAGEPDPAGEPVPQTFRDVLGTTRTTVEALALIEARRPIVPHMLLVVDATGDAAVAERVPGQPLYVRRADPEQPLPLTNHFEGPGADDEKNQRVCETTSTLPRRARLDALLSNRSGPPDVQRAVEILRDKAGADGSDLPLGAREAIDGLIATHSVVVDPRGGSLWVNEGPHVTGRFVRFDLKQLLDPAFRPEGPARVESMPADVIVEDGRYDAWRADGSPH